MKIRFEVIREALFIYSSSLLRLPVSESYQKCMIFCEGYPNLEPSTQGLLEATLAKWQWKRQFVNRAKINNTYENKRKEVSVSANDDSGPQKKRIKKRCSCSVDKCTNKAVKGVVCNLASGHYTSFPTNGLTSPRGQCSCSP
eukprot:scaffold1025_cov147-Skeletonema_dohrnii-CCMP3373.AAC.4